MLYVLICKYNLSIKGVYKMLLVYRLNSLFCYDTDDFTLEKTNEEELKELVKRNSNLFSNVRYIKKLDTLRISSVHKTICKYLPELVMVDDNTMIWVSKSLSRVLVFSYETCYTTMYLGANIDESLPVILDGLIYISRSGFIKSVDSLYYIGDYNYNTLRREIAIKGDSFLNRYKVTDSVFAINIQSGVPLSTLTRLREKW